MHAIGGSTWEDVSQRPRTILAVPLGSLEQHGPHLPLSTDTTIAVALATLLAREHADVVLTPPIAIGASGEHAGFAGTLSVGSNVLRDLIVELVRSADWADGVVLVNGHGGNSEAVRSAVALLHAEGRSVLSWWPNLPEDPHADSHAGWLETSVMLHLAPQSVFMERAAAGDPRPLDELLPTLRSVGVAGVSANGVLGDPAGANAEAGARIIEDWARDLVNRVRQWAP